MFAELAPGQKLKIVVPVNFSKKSEMALDFALSFWAGKNTEVYLFHVFEESTSNFRRLDALNEEYMERMKQMVIQAVERLSHKGIAHTVDQVHRRMAHGKASNEIITMAEGVRSDIIVMGAPTQSQFKKIATKAPCSLVLLKEKDF
jgi:nucleotide-binding universal stress UspA family protein